MTSSLMNVYARAPIAFDRGEGACLATAEAASGMASVRVAA